VQRSTVFAVPPTRLGGTDLEAVLIAARVEDVGLVQSTGPLVEEEGRLDHIAGSGVALGLAGQLNAPTSIRTTTGRQCHT
jgi:hypothetical protein